MHAEMSLFSSKLFWQKWQNRSVKGFSFVILFTNTLEVSCAYMKPHRRHRSMHHKRAAGYCACRECACRE